MAVTLAPSHATIGATSHVLTNVTLPRTSTTTLNSAHLTLAVRADALVCSNAPPGNDFGPFKATNVLDEKALPPAPTEDTTCSDMDPCYKATRNQCAECLSYFKRRLNLIYHRRHADTACTAFRLFSKETKEKKVATDNCRLPTMTRCPLCHQRVTPIGQEEPATSTQLSLHFRRTCSMADVCRRIWVTTVPVLDFWLLGLDGRPQSSIDFGRWMALRPRWNSQTSRVVHDSLFAPSLPQERWERLKSFDSLIRLGQAWCTTGHPCTRAVVALLVRDDKPLSEARAVRLPSRVIVDDEHDEMLLAKRSDPWAGSLFRDQTFWNRFLHARLVASRETYVNRTWMAGFDMSLFAQVTKAARIACAPVLPWISPPRPPSPGTASIPLIATVNLALHTAIVATDSSLLFQMCKQIQEEWTSVNRMLFQSLCLLPSEPSDCHDRLSIELLCDSLCPVDDKHGGVYEDGNDTNSNGNVETATAAATATVAVGVLSREEIERLTRSFDRACRRFPSILGFFSTEASRVEQEQQQQSSAGSTLPGVSFDCGLPKDGRSSAIDCKSDATSPRRLTTWTSTCRRYLLFQCFDTSIQWTVRTQYRFLCWWLWNDHYLHTLLRNRPVETGVRATAKREPTFTEPVLKRAMRLQVPYLIGGVDSQCPFCTRLQPADSSGLHHCRVVLAPPPARTMSSVPIHIRATTASAAPAAPVAAAAAAASAAPVSLRTSISLVDSASLWHSWYALQHRMWMSKVEHWEARFFRSVVATPHRRKANIDRDLRLSRVFHELYTWREAKIFARNSGASAVNTPDIYALPNGMIQTALNGRVASQSTATSTPAIFSPSATGFWCILNVHAISDIYQSTGRLHTVATLARVYSHTTRQTFVVCLDYVYGLLWMYNYGEAPVGTLPDDIWQPSVVYILSTGDFCALLTNFHQQKREQ